MIQSIVLFACLIQYIEQKSTGKLEKRKTPENIKALSENEDDPLAM